MSTDISSCTSLTNAVTSAKTTEDVEQWFTQTGWPGKLQDYPSNMKDTTGWVIGTAPLTFSATHFMYALIGMHRLTGKSQYATDITTLIEYIFARTDVELYASCEFSDYPYNNGDLLPYERPGVPVNWDINTPWCGWSRLFNLAG